MSDWKPLNIPKPVVPPPSPDSYDPNFPTAAPMDSAGPLILEEHKQWGLPAETDLQRMERVQKQSELIAAARRPSGNIIKVEPENDTDYILLYTDRGHVVPVPRWDAFERVLGIVRMLRKEDGASRPDIVDRDIWCCDKIFQAAIRNGIARKEHENQYSPWYFIYQTDFRKKFAKALRKIEKEWRNKLD